jgi:CheY-like chemotaxis protein
LNPASPTLAALIVDDDPSVCGVFSRLLTRMGYAVQTLDNGASALELVKSTTFDVCLVDKQLPGMGGPTCW